MAGLITVQKDWQKVHLNSAAGRAAVDLINAVDPDVTREADIHLKDLLMAMEREERVFQACSWACDDITKTETDCSELVLSHARYLESKRAYNNSKAQLQEIVALRFGDEFSANFARDLILICPEANFTLADLILTIQYPLCSEAVNSNHA